MSSRRRSSFTSWSSSSTIREMQQCVRATGGSRIINKTTTLVLDLYEHQSQSQLCFSGPKCLIGPFFRNNFSCYQSQVLWIYFPLLNFCIRNNRTPRRSARSTRYNQHSITIYRLLDLAKFPFGSIDATTWLEMKCILCLVARSWIDSAMEDVCEILDRTAGEKRRDLYVVIPWSR